MYVEARRTSALGLRRGIRRRRDVSRSAPASAEPRCATGSRIQSARRDRASAARLRRSATRRTTRVRGAARLLPRRRQHRRGRRDVSTCASSCDAHVRRGSSRTSTHGSSLSVRPADGPTTSCAGVVVVQRSRWKHWPCLFPQHGPGRKHERPIVLEDWQRTIVEAHPGPFLRGLFHSDGCRAKNWTRKIVAGRDEALRLPALAVHQRLRGHPRAVLLGLDLVDIPWRQSNCEDDQRVDPRRGRPARRADRAQEVGHGQVASQTRPCATRRRPAAGRRRRGPRRSGSARCRPPGARGTDTLVPGAGGLSRPRAGRTRRRPRPRGAGGRRHRRRQRDQGRDRGAAAGRLHLAERLAELPARRRASRVHTPYAWPRRPTATSPSPTGVTCSRSLNSSVRGTSLVGPGQAVGGGPGHRDAGQPVGERGAADHRPPLAVVDLADREGDPVRRRWRARGRRRGARTPRASGEVQTAAPLTRLPEIRNPSGPAAIRDTLVASAPP